MRFAGSIVKLSSIPGVVSSGHVIIAYPVSTPFTPGTEIMVCDSHGKPCERSCGYARKIKRTILKILFIYRPTQYS